MDKFQYMSPNAWRTLAGTAAYGLYNSWPKGGTSKPSYRPRPQRFRGGYRNRPTGPSFKKRVMKLHPAKHYTGEANPTLLHNTLVTMCPTQGITQGDGNANRDGDAIHLEALKMKCSAVSATTSGAYQYRLIVGWSGEEYTTAGIAGGFTSGIGTSEIFLPNVATWIPSSIINPKAFTVLYDQTIDVNSQISNVQDINNFSVTVPIQQSFSYQSSGSVQGKSRNLYVVLVGSVAGGTTGTTSAGQVLVGFDLIFKNQ